MKFLMSMDEDRQATLYDNDTLFKIAIHIEILDNIEYSCFKCRFTTSSTMCHHPRGQP